MYDFYDSYSAIVFSVCPRIFSFLPAFGRNDNNYSHIFFLYSCGALQLNSDKNNKRRLNCILCFKVEHLNEYRSNHHILQVATIVHH